MGVEARYTSSTRTGMRVEGHIRWVLGLAVHPGTGMMAYKGVSDDS